jgi:hypothetical protein
MQCRFCLETGGHALISPCKCRGSVKYIHAECRRKWVIVDDIIQEERLLCSICKAPLYENLETLFIQPQENQLSSVIIFKPFESALVMYLILPRFNLYPSSSIHNTLFSSHVFIQCFYTLLYLLHARIKNLRLYGHVILYRRSYIHVLFHALFLYYFFKDANILMGLASNMSLAVYLKEHNEILSTVNEMLIKN